MSGGSAPSGAMVVARGEASLGGGDRYARGIVSKIRYADQVAWTLAGAVGEALAPIAERIAAVRDRVAVATTSDIGPRDTLGEVGRAAGRGQCSPLRFAAASPGSLAAVACVAFAFKGPSLNLVMRARRGTPTLWLLAEQWLARDAAAVVFVASFATRPADAPPARCVVLARESAGGEAVSDPAWARDWIAAEAS